MLCARSRSTRLVRDRCSGLPFQDQGRDLCRARTRVPLFRGWLTPPLRRRPSLDTSSLPSQDLVLDTPCTARLRHGFVRSIARTTIGEGGGVWGSAGKKGISTFPESQGLRDRISEIGSSGVLQTERSRDAEGGVSKQNKTVLLTCGPGTTECMRGEQVNFFLAVCGTAAFGSGHGCWQHSCVMPPRSCFLF